MSGEECLSIFKTTKSLFRLVIGAVLTFKVPYMQLVEIQPKSNLRLVIRATLTSKGFLIYAAHKDPLK
jgi:hypothetical protein